MLGFYNTQGNITMDAVSSPSNSDIDVVRLAREIAMDIQPLNKILEQYAISNETWSELQRNSRFRMILACEAEAWSTAMNVHERVKVKSAAMLEEFLPELYARMNDREQAFPAVIEAGKMLAKMAGIGNERGDATAAIGERFVINISMGPQVAPVEFTKDVTPQVTIEHEAPKNAGN